MDDDKVTDRMPRLGGVQGGRDKIIQKLVEELAVPGKHNQEEVDRLCQILNRKPQVNLSRVK